MTLRFDHRLRKIGHGSKPFDEIDAAPGVQNTHFRSMHAHWFEVIHPLFPVFSFRLPVVASKKN